MKRNINRCKIRNLSLALLIFISQGARAMERAETTEASQQAPKNNYETILREIEELTKRIHAEVDKVLPDYKRDTEEYHRRMGATKKIAIQKTLNNRVDSAKLDEAIKLKISLDFLDNLKEDASKEDIDNLLDQKIAIGKQLNKADPKLVKEAKELNLRFDFLAYLKEDASQKYIDYLIENRRTVIQVKLNKADPELVKKAKELNLSFDFLFNNTGAVNQKDIDKLLDQKIKIQERLNKADPQKVKDAEKLNLSFDFLVSIKTDAVKEEVDKALDEKISPIQEKLKNVDKNLVKKALELKVSFDFLSENVNPNKIDSLLNREIFQKEKIREALREGVSQGILDHIKYIHEDNNEKFKGNIDREVKIQKKINEALSIGLKYKNIEDALRIDRGREQKLDKAIKEQQLINEIQELERKAKALGVSEKALKEISEKYDNSWTVGKETALQDEKKQLQEQIAIQEKANKLTELGKKTFLIKTVEELKQEASGLHNLNESLDQYIKLQNKINTAVELDVDPKAVKEKYDAVKTGYKGGVYDLSNWLDTQINIQNKVAELLKIGKESKISGIEEKLKAIVKKLRERTLKQPFENDSDLLRYLDNQIRIQKCLNKADPELALKAYNENVNLDFFNELGYYEFEEVEKDYINRFLSYIISLQDAINEAKKLGINLDKFNYQIAKEIKKPNTFNGLPSDIRSYIEQQKEGKKLEKIKKIESILRIISEDIKNEAKELGVNFDLLLDLRKNSNDINKWVNDINKWLNEQISAYKTLNEAINKSFVTQEEVDQFKTNHKDKEFTKKDVVDWIDQKTTSKKESEKGSEHESPLPKVSKEKLEPETPRIEVSKEDLPILEPGTFQNLITNTPKPRAFEVSRVFPFIGKMQKVYNTLNKPQGDDGIDSFARHLLTTEKPISSILTPKALMVSCLAAKFFGDGQVNKYDKQKDHRQSALAFRVKTQEGSEKLITIYALYDHLIGEAMKMHQEADYKSNPIFRENYKKLLESLKEAEKMTQKEKENAAPVHAPEAFQNLIAAQNKEGEKAYLPGNFQLLSTTQNKLLNSYDTSLSKEGGLSVSDFARLLLSNENIFSIPQIFDASNLIKAARSAIKFGDGDVGLYKANDDPKRYGILFWNTDSYGNSRAVTSYEFYSHIIDQAIKMKNDPQYENNETFKKNYDTLMKGLQEALAQARNDGS